MRKTAYHNYKKLFSFRKFGLLLWLGSSREFASQTKLTVTSRDKKCFYSMLNQQSSQSIRVFFILHLISRHPRESELFYFMA